MTKVQKNVLGENLENCSNNPLTGWYRDGCCNTDENDHDHFHLYYNIHLYTSLSKDYLNSFLSFHLKHFFEL